MTMGMRMGKARSRAAAVAVSGALLLGAGALAAPSASAAGSDGCTTNDRNHWVSVQDLGDAAIHTGPGAKYRTKGTVYFGQAFKVSCSTKNGYGHRWLYGQKENTTTKGWIQGSRTVRL